MHRQSQQLQLTSAYSMHSLFFFFLTETFLLEASAYAEELEITGTCRNWKNTNLKYYLKAAELRMWESSRLPENAPKYLNERSLEFHSCCWLLGQHQHSQGMLLPWHDIHCREGPHSLLHNRQPWLTVVWQTNAFPALWNISSELLWQLDEEDGQGAHRVCRWCQVPAVLTHAAPLASKPHEEEGTRLNCDQTAFCPESWARLGCVPRGNARKQHKQGHSPWFHTGRGFHQQCQHYFAIQPLLVCSFQTSEFYTQWFLEWASILPTLTRESQTGGKLCSTSNSFPARFQHLAWPTQQRKLPGSSWNPGCGLRKSDIMHAVKNKISNKIFHPHPPGNIVKKKKMPGKRATEITWELQHLCPSAPVLEKILLPSLTKSPSAYQEQSFPNLNAELLASSHCFWLMSVFAISLFSLMLSPRIH